MGIEDEHLQKLRTSFNKVFEGNPEIGISLFFLLYIMVYDFDFIGRDFTEK